MNINKQLLRFFGIFSLLIVFQACIEDDDFDFPTIPPITEDGEILSQGGTSAPFLTCHEQNFESTDDDVSTFTEYENVSTLGTRLWEVASFNNNSYLALSAFAANEPIFTYFVIPVNFDSADSFSFTTQDRFNNGDPLKVLIVTDYAIDGDITQATTQDITSNFSIATGTTGAASQAPVPSGSYDLTNLTGNGFIAFKYESNGTVTTTIHIDDIAIIDNEDATCTITDPDAFVNQGGANAVDQSCNTEDFETYAADQTDFPEYESISNDSGRFWEVEEFSANKYLKLNAFAGTGNPVATFQSYFLVSVNFDNADTFRFKTQDRFHNGDPLKIYSTTDYAGDIETATLTDITSNFTISSGNTESATMPFVDSGDFSLASLTGNGHIVFEYVADGATSTTIHVDDIEIIDSDDTSCGTVTEPAKTILISELADPNNDANARFVEIWNYGTETVDLTGWSLQRWTNGNTDITGSSRVDLVGSITAGDAFVVAHDDGAFQTAYGIVPDQVDNASSTDSNGDDQIGLFDPDGNLHDIFGVPGEDGSGTNHEFEDGRARRKANIMMENTTYTFAEWDVWNDTGSDGTTNEPQDAPGNFTPGVHPDATTTTGNISLDVFFSEYVEGSGNNKYFEIFNPSGDEIDLTRYLVRNSANSTTDWSADRDLVLNGTLASNSTFVVSNENADAAITGVADLIATGTNPTFYNGDDALGLFVDSDGDGTFETMLDIIGVITEDPGAGWAVAGVADATQNMTLVRKTTVTTGNTNWTASAGTNTTDSEWIVNALDDFSSIGIR